MVEKNYNIWILSILYAFIFVYVIMWIDIKGHDFEDIVQYMRRMEYLHHGGKEKVYSGLRWLTSEPLWKWIIIQLGNIFTDHRFAMYLVSFIALSLHTSFLIRRVSLTIALIFLINPMSVDLMMAQVRIALAFGLVLVAYDLKSKPLVIMLLIMSILIHASMPIFFGVYYILFKLNQKVEPKKLYLVALIMGLLLALFMKYGINGILAFIGDRHTDYDNAKVVSTVSYSLVWIIISTLLATFGDFFSKEQRQLAAYTIVFMSFFFFASALGVFGKRYVAVIMVIIISTISYLPKHFKEWTYLLLFIYNIYLFKFWLVT